MEYKFTDANFETEVLQSDLPVLVDFYADWCVPCKMMAPIVKEMAEKYDGRIKIGKLNIEESPQMTEKYGVMSIPTFICFIFYGRSFQKRTGFHAAEYIKDRGCHTG